MEKFLTVLLMFVLGAGLVALDGVILMWLVSVWHGIRPAIPAMGFGESVLVSAIVSVLTFKVPSKR